MSPLLQSISQQYIVNGFDNEWDAAVYFFENMYNTKPEDVIVENESQTRFTDDRVHIVVEKMSNDNESFKIYIVDNVF